MNTPLLPVLIPLTQPESVATVALSRTHAAAFVLDGALQSPIDLGRAGLTIRAAWDLSAAHLMRLSSSPAGLEVWLRPSPTDHGWVDVAVAGAPATSWLAHPRTFTALDRMLRQRLGSPVAYRADGSLRAAPAPQADPPFLTYKDGFPVAGAPAARPVAPLLVS